MREDILKLVDDLVIQGIFTVDAVEGINKIKTTVKEQEAQIEAYKIESERLEKLCNEYKATAARDSSKITMLVEKIAKLEEQEEKAKKAIYEAEKQQAVAGAYKDAMQIVFRPNTVRETVARFGSSPQNGISTHYNDSATITREDAPQ